MVLAQFAQTNDWDGLNSFPDNQHIILNKIVFFILHTVTVCQNIGANEW